MRRDKILLYSTQIFLLLTVFGISIWDQFCLDLLVVLMLPYCPKLKQNHQAFTVEVRAPASDCLDLNPSDASFCKCHPGQFM